MAEVTLTKDNFEEKVLKEELPVLVDFWAPWCGPCKMQNPILEELSEEMKDKLVVAKVNVDNNQDLAAQYGVMSIPTIKIFYKGEVKSEMIGVQTKDKLVSEVEKISQ